MTYPSSPIERAFNLQPTRKTPIKVLEQGAPILNNDYAYMLMGGAGAVCFFVDLDSKHCELFGTCRGDQNTPELIIGATSETSTVHGNDRDAFTRISFPEFSGWDVHCANISRYTIAVALSKR